MGRQSAALVHNATIAVCKLLDLLDMHITLIVLLSTGFVLRTHRTTAPYTHANGMVAPLPAHMAMVKRLERSGSIHQGSVRVRQSTRRPFTEDIFAPSYPI